jgi:hypothetical protein
MWGREQDQHLLNTYYIPGPGLGFFTKYWSLTKPRVVSLEVM